MKSQNAIWLKLYLEVSQPIDLPMVLPPILVKKKEIDPALVHSLLEVETALRLVADLVKAEVGTTRVVLKAYWQAVH